MNALQEMLYIANIAPVFALWYSSPLDYTLVQYFQQYAHYSTLVFTTQTVYFVSNFHRLNVCSMQL